MIDLWQPRSSANGERNAGQHPQLVIIEIKLKDMEFHSEQVDATTRNLSEKEHVRKTGQFSANVIASYFQIFLHDQHIERPS